MTPIESAKHKACQAAHHLLRELSPGGIVPEIALVLGTGWGGSLELQGQREIPFQNIACFPNSVCFPGHSLLEIPGHARKVICGDLGKKRVIALSGRVHLNENPLDPEVPKMVRLQIQMLLEMGVRKFILTNAVGSLDPECRVGEIVIVDGLVTLFAPSMPLFAGEFCSPEDTLSGNMLHIARECTSLTGHELPSHLGGYAMVAGPFFEGRLYDKRILRKCGASCVGMSLLPELCTIALYGGKALCLSFITNSADEEHSHETNQARAKESSALLGSYLRQIIERI